MVISPACQLRDARTLSGEKDFLRVAWQPQPRRSLRVGQHLHPVNELLTPTGHREQHVSRATQR